MEETFCLSSVAAVLLNWYEAGSAGKRVHFFSLNRTNSEDITEDAAHKLNSLDSEGEPGNE